VRRLLVPIVCAALLAPAGCAYYNTFYLARKYFREAREKEERSPSDKLSPDVAASYDKAIEKSTKVIAHHSGSRWVDDAIYLIGMSLVGKRDYDGALKKFQELEANYPKSPLVSDAVFMSGVCYQKQRNYATASAIFARVMRDFPKFERRDEVLLIVARGTAEEKKGAEAIALYKDLVARYPKSDFRYPAFIEMGDQYAAAGAPDSAGWAYASAARTARNGDDEARALLKLSASLVSAGKPEEGRLEAEKALAAAKLTEVQADARLAAGTALVAAGQYDAAIQAYQSAIDVSARTLAAAQAQYQIGYVREIHMQDPVGAREAYEKVKIQMAKSAFTEQAALRSKNLERMQQFSQGLTGSGNEAARAAFQLAELNYFQFSKVDEALEMYAKVETDFPESPFAPKASYARAWILRAAKGDTASSDAEYQRVVDLYPRSEAAAKAREALGLPPVFFAPDTLAAADSTLADSLGRAVAAGDSLAGAAGAVADTAAADTLERRRGPDEERLDQRRRDLPQEMRDQMRRPPEDPADRGRSRQSQGQ
jgi:TolA-binding protein